MDDDPTALGFDPDDRHENIRRSTGVSVPVPVDSTTVMKAVNNTNHSDKPSTPKW